jgi:hypothetical protein
MRHCPYEVKGHVKISVPAICLRMVLYSAGCKPRSLHKLRRSQLQERRLVPGCLLPVEALCIREG